MRLDVDAGPPVTGASWHRVHTLREMREWFRWRMGWDEHFLLKSKHIFPPFGKHPI
jgi:hypothetical protein